MSISFFNPSDLIGCGGDINQSEEGYTEGVCGGGTQRGYMEGYVERVCGGGTQVVHGGVCRGGMWRGVHHCSWLPLVAHSNHRFSG